MVRRRLVMIRIATATVKKTTTAPPIIMTSTPVALRRSVLPEPAALETPDE